MEQYSIWDSLFQGPWARQVPQERWAGLLFNLAEEGREERWKRKEGRPGKEVAHGKAWRWDSSWLPEAPGGAQGGPPLAPAATCTNRVSDHWWAGGTSQSGQATAGMAEMPEGQACLYWKTSPCVHL